MVNIKKTNGNIDNITYEEVINNIDNAFKEVEIIKRKSINRKNTMKFSEYKKLINTYTGRIFNNYISTEEYEKKNGWKLKISVDGWAEDNYVIKYFNKSLSGYLRNYIRKINGISRNKKYIPCSNCGILISPTNNRQKYCKSCWKEKEEEDNRRYARESMRRKRQNNNVKGLENP